MTENGSVKRGVLFEDEDHNITKLVESSIERNEKGEIICEPLDGSDSFIVPDDQPVSMNLFVFNKDLHIISDFSERIYSLARLSE